MADDYIRDSDLACYHENEWLDFFLSDGLAQLPRFEYAPYDLESRCARYHSKVVAEVTTILAKLGSYPSNLLEIGSSLGRTFFDVCTRVKSIETATLIEPSANLRKHFSKLFSGETIQFPLVYGNERTIEISVNTERIKAACSHVSYKVIDTEFQHTTLSSNKFDLVLCLNVLDQCESPLQLLDFLKDVTRPNGVLAIACTYQWPSRHCEDKDFRIKNILDHFSSWERLGENNLAFNLLENERYWAVFMSHLVVLKKPNEVLTSAKQ